MADTTAAQSGSKPAFEPLPEKKQGRTHGARMLTRSKTDLIVTAGGPSVCLTAEDQIGGAIVVMTPAEAAATGRELLRAAGADHTPALLEALRRLLPWPFTVPASHAAMVEFWQREQAQGNGYAADALFALNAIAAAEAQQ